jgi:hypothetical protein
MSELQLHRTMQQQGLRDAWVAADRPGDKPRSLSDIYEHFCGSQKAVVLIHADDLHLPEPPRVQLTLGQRRSEEQAQQRAAAQKKKTRGLLFQFLGLAVLIALVLIIVFRDELFTRPAPPPPPSIEELIAEAAAQDAFSERVRLPALQLIATYSRNQFLLINAGEEVWPSLMIRLNKKDTGPYFVSAEPIHPGQTLRLPMREFKTDRSEPFQLADEEELRRIFVEVEGFEPFSQHF